MIDERAEFVMERVARKHYVTVKRMRNHGEYTRWMAAARREAALELMRLGYTAKAAGVIMNRHPVSVLNLQGRIGNRKRKQE